MNTHDLTLEKTIIICKKKNDELNVTRMKEMSLADLRDVHVFTKDREYRRKTKNKGPRQGGYRQYHGNRNYSYAYKHVRRPAMTTMENPVLLQDKHATDVMEEITSRDVVEPEIQA